MDKPKVTDEMIEALAEKVVEDMDIESLMGYVQDDLIYEWQQDEDLFWLNLQLYDEDLTIEELLEKLT